MAGGQCAKAQKDAPLATPPFNLKCGGKPGLTIRGLVSPTDVAHETVRRTRAPIGVPAKCAAES